MAKRKLSPPLSRSDGFRHIENYYRSGLRPSEYYTQHGLSEWQFYSWRKRYLKEHPTIEHPVNRGHSFHRILLEEHSDYSFSGMEIHYPHGVKVVIGSGVSLSIAHLTSLIQVVV
jgi:hypothetical protein